MLRRAALQEAAIVNHHVPTEDVFTAQGIITLSVLGYQSLKKMAAQLLEVPPEPFKMNFMYSTYSDFKSDCPKHQAR